MTGDKARRQQTIVDVVRGRAIASQDELSEALREHGCDVTQSTLSRDLRELRILRVPVEGGYRYLPAGEEGPAVSSPAARGLGALASAEVLAIDANEAMVVVRTQVARAQGVASYLDGLGLEELLATVGGDDTVLAIPSSVKGTGALRARLEELFGLG